MTMDVEFDPIQFLKEQNEKLQLLLDAEREHVRRLSTAVAHYKEACGIGYGLLKAAKIEAEEESYIGVEAFTDAIGGMVAATEAGDDLLLPTAEEE